MPPPDTHGADNVFGTAKRCLRSALANHARARHAVGVNPIEIAPRRPRSTASSGMPAWSREAITWQAKASVPIPTDDVFDASAHVLQEVFRQIKNKKNDRTDTRITKIWNNTKK